MRFQERWLWVSRWDKEELKRAQMKCQKWVEFSKRDSWVVRSGFKIGISGFIRRNKEVLTSVKS